MDSATDTVEGGNKETGNVVEETADTKKTQKSAESGKSQKKTSANGNVKDATEQPSQKTPLNSGSGDAEKSSKKAPLSKHKSADRPDYKWSHNKVFFHFFDVFKIFSLF